MYRTIIQSIFLGKLKGCIVAVFSTSFLTGGELQANQLFVMKKILTLISSLFLIIMIIGVFHGSREVAGVKKVLAQENIPNGPPCPHFLVQDGDDADTEPDHVPTTPFGSECRLNRDVIGLVEPLKLESGIKLNCQGHKILPSAAGQPDNPITPEFDAVFSQPQLVIFLNELHGTEIQNCQIGDENDYGFDFGILAINSKVPEDVKNDPTVLEQLRNKVINNEINASYVAINLTASDNFELIGNIITYFVRGGSAILVQYGSQMNTIKYNTITGDLKAAGALAVPGPTDLNPDGSSIQCPEGVVCLNSNPVVNVLVGGVIVTQVLGPHPQLFNTIIEGNPPSLHQLTFPISSELTEDFTADNIVEGNDISFNIASSLQASSRESGIVAPSSLRTIILANNVTNTSGVGVRDGQLNARRLFPGKCTLDSNRHCLADDDCFIPGIDDISKGTCADPLPEPTNAEWFARDILVEDNEITGPFRGGISMAAKNATIRGNKISGPLITAGGLGGIVLRGKFALETDTVVTRNVVSNVSTALRLEKTFGLTGSFFDAEIRLNDFTGYTTAVRTSNDYNLPSELSGNFWGLTCGEGGFDPNMVRRDNGTVNPNVVESHPYGEPVANTSEEDLPLTCF